jgi:predicted ester cyclase/ketosteroid isomerase-like protein
MSQDIKEAVRRFLEGEWTYEKRVALCDVLTSDYVMHGPTGDIVGCRAYQEAIAAELENIDHMFVKVEDSFAEGDRVVARCSTWFELHGEFMGAYSPGHPIRMQSISIHRVSDGKIAESWEAYDRRSFLRDLGATQTLSDGERSAIEGVIASALRIGLRDKKAHADLYYAPSAEVVAANGEAMSGRRNILAWLERFPPISDWRLTNLEIDGAGEVAYVRGSYTMLLSSRAKLPFDRGKYLEVWRKQADGSWKVIRHIFSSEIASRTRHRAAPALAHA